MFKCLWFKKQAKTRDPAKQGTERLDSTTPGSAQVQVTIIPPYPTSTASPSSPSSRLTLPSIQINSAPASSLRGNPSAQVLPIVGAQRLHITSNPVSGAGPRSTHSPRAPGFSLTGPNQTTATPAQRAPPISQATRHAPNTSFRTPVARRSGPGTLVPSTLALPTNTLHSPAGTSAIIPRSSRREHRADAQRPSPLAGSIAAPRRADCATRPRQPHWAPSNDGRANKQQQSNSSRTTPELAVAVSTGPHSTSAVSFSGLALGSRMIQTGNGHTSFSRWEAETVGTQYHRTTHDLQASVYWTHSTSSTTEDRHPLSSSTTSHRNKPPIPSTRAPFISVSVPSHHQKGSSSEPAFQFTGGEMNAGGDIGSRNILQQGDGNEIHIHHGAIEQHESCVRRITERLGSYVASDATLSKDMHGDPSLCYQGTREELLKNVLSWVGNPAEPRKDVGYVASRALCIVGAPGSGKSTIMNTLILKLLRDAARQSPGLIAAHYCIRRSLQSTTDGSKVLPTLILQLARRDPDIAKRVSTLLDETLHTDVFTPELQEDVFLQAISAYNEVVLVIVDALDEASRPASFAAMLSRIIPVAPQNLRLLLATRNEHGVLQSLGPELLSKIVHNIPTEESVVEVSRYITRRLKDGLTELFGTDPSWRYWPNNSQLCSLSTKAGGLYIWARTAVDFILSRVEKRGEINRDRLIEDVGRVGMADVNALYMLILRRSSQDEVDAEDGTVMQRIKAVLGFIIVAENPLPLDDIVGFLGHRDFDVRNFVRLNRSILVPGTEDIAGSTIPQFHKTFSDFLTSDRAEEFQIKVGDVHRSAASRCFEMMDSLLRFNICGLRSSFSANEEIIELATSVPKGLIYASTSWWYHLASTLRDSGSQPLHPSYLPCLKTLLYENLLFWLEIVSLCKEKKASAGWMKGLADLLENNEVLTGTDVNEVSFSMYARDAYLLIEMFSACIGASIPHLYISLLAFSPRDSVVANHYRMRSATTVIPHPSGLPPQWHFWDADPRMADDGSVYSVSFSPCGRLLAAGYEKGTIRIWSVGSGVCRIRIGPLKGHRDTVHSVCFSLDGLLIASSSKDKTIRVWDAQTGECVLGPLIGHTCCVFSVAFSPDNTRVVSGSEDDIVRVWGVHTGDCVLGPLKGHRDDVKSVSYSPDGMCIASGSSDATIRLWNAQTGECSGRPLAGHRQWISSLSFHPDGSLLVSGSGDKTLRIWDIQEGTCTHGPLTGHLSWVRCVCFSPDGRYIASGSEDRTIRIWNTETAVCIAGPFGGASSGVSSVAFSPEGKYLAAGSWDGTVRLWDFNALLTAGLGEPIPEGEVPTQMEITDYTPAAWEDGWTLGPRGELLFWAREGEFRYPIWRPSTVRILGRPSMIKPDLSNLVTGEEWLGCFPSS